MRDKIELILAILGVAAMGIGGLVAVLVVQPWFWLAVIAIVLINKF